MYEMKIINIIGDDYSGKWERVRVGCRGIIIEDGSILLSCETRTDLWMIPGGGLEPGETEVECCIREVREETGLIVSASPCVLEIDEFYGNRKYVNLYYYCNVEGLTNRSLTEAEKAGGMEPRRIPTQKALDIFSGYEKFAETDENRRGMYLREYTALLELLK